MTSSLHRAICNAQSLERVVRFVRPTQFVLLDRMILESEKQILLSI